MAFCSPKIYLCFKKRSHLWREVQSKSIGVSKISETVFTSNLCYNLTKIFSECIAQSRPGARIAWLGGEGGQKEILGGTRSLFEYGSNEKGEDQKKKKGLRPEISTNSGCRLKILAIFDEIWSEDQKKRSSSQNLNEIRRKFTKITKRQFLLTNSRAVNTGLGILGLDLHSSSLEPVNFFVAQSSLGGAQAVIWGARPGMPLLLRRAWLKVIRSCFGISLITLCVLFSLSFVYLSGLPTKMRDDQ